MNKISLDKLAKLTFYFSKIAQEKDFHGFFKEEDDIKIIIYSYYSFFDKITNINLYCKSIIDNNDHYKQTDRKFFIDEFNNPEEWYKGLNKFLLIFNDDMTAIFNIIYSLISNLNFQKSISLFYKKDISLNIDNIKWDEIKQILKLIVNTFSKYYNKLTDFAIFEKDLKEIYNEEPDPAGAIIDIGETLSELIQCLGDIYEIFSIDIDAENISNYIKQEAQELAKNYLPPEEEEFEDAVKEYMDPEHWEDPEAREAFRKGDYF